jgi:hypothetical protein
MLFYIHPKGIVVRRGAGAPALLPSMVRRLIDAWVAEVGKGPR